MQHDDGRSVAQGLERQLQRLREARVGQQSPGGGVLARLHAQCQLRAPLFEPEAEQRALIDSLADLL